MDELRWAALAGWVAVGVATAVLLWSTRRSSDAAKRFGPIAYAAASLTAVALAVVRFAEAL